MATGKLDPQVEALLQQMEQQGTPLVHTLTPMKARESRNPVFIRLGGPPEAFASRLKQAGVPVTYTYYEGMIHAFFSLAALVGRARDAMDEVTGALRSAFAK